MTWFRIDDLLPDHRKVRRLGRDRVAAVGLWTLCGSWSAGQLSDGFVPGEIVQRYDPKEQLAAALVGVGLWHVEEQAGEPGYRFHDWGDWQPTREQVETEREAAKQRQRRARERRANGASSHTNGHAVELRTDTERHASRERDDGVTSGVSSRAPTRPDPTRPVLEVPSGTSEGGTRGRAPARAAMDSVGPPPLPSEIENTQAATAALAADERPGDHWPEQPCGNRHDPERSCRRCGVARRTAQDQAAEASQLEADERAAEAERRRSCQACDPNGWIEHPDTGNPLVRCDHERDRRSQLADALDHAS